MSETRQNPSTISALHHRPDGRLSLSNSPRPSAGDDIGDSGFQGALTMLEQQSDFIRHCYDRAARAKRVAESSQSQSDRDFHLQVERNWLCLATSQAFAERVTRFVSQTANPVRREAAVAVLRAASFEQPLVEAM